MKLTNSTNNKKEELNPIRGEVRVYVCGPTVYDSSHLGHARSAITFDLLHRTLKENLYDVTFVKNFTDIDDKILNKMKNTNETLEEITTKYINEYQNDMNLLNVLPNTYTLKATDNIKPMINFINNLIKNGSAYKIKDDGIYFDINSYSKYGKLFNKLSEDNREDVEKNTNKKNERDFSLWKFDLNSPIIYETPFGNGRPGWHIECSVMINEHLAYKDRDYQIDIHGGGSDLMFPHHENEEAQTFAHSKQKLAKTWVHNGFVTINGEKMSKSLGNSFYLKDIFKKYNPEVIRFYLMSNHYKSNFDFNEVDLISSKKRLDKLYRLKQRVFDINTPSYPNKFYNDVKNALNDDLNTPIALSVIDNFINFSNEKLDKKTDVKKLVSSVINSFDSIIGIGYQNPYKYFQFGLDKEFIDLIENKIEIRNVAKVNKDYHLADSIRNELKDLNISLMDTKDGTMWEILNEDLNYLTKDLN